MIVFGDPQFQTTLSEIAGAIRHKAEKLSLTDLDATRALLIQAGQLEQAISDLRPPDLLLEIRAMRAADGAADIFLAALASQMNGFEKPFTAPHLLQAGLIADLQEMEQSGGALELRVKVPEGFEFYCLFPEQYCVSALRWADQFNDFRDRPVLVVGIRSIGTTLSAVLAAVLRAAGWDIKRLTVRPGGHPFQRQCQLDAEQISPAKHAIIVDEGPGISGSSFMAVSGALTRAGLAANRITLFPAHDHGPSDGEAGAAREWWATAPQMVTALDDVRWNGATLREGLSRFSASAFFFGEDSCEQLEDFSAGKWREAAYERETDWPAVCAQFESTKYRLRIGGKKVIWKFTGLGAFVDGLKTAAGLGSFADRSAPEPLGWFRGFSAFRWVDGARLTAADAVRPEVRKEMAAFLCRRAGPPLGFCELESAISRLAGMLEFNGSRAFGDEWKPNIAVASPAVLRDSPSSSGAGWAPHEWVFAPGGRLINTDPAGHGIGHTMIGKQPILWDVAAVLVEWRLTGDLRKNFLGMLGGAGLRIELRGLAFFEAAYTAFRMGQTFLCASMMAGSSPEHQRLMRAFHDFRKMM
jgi:hypothetical protein